MPHSLDIALKNDSDLSSIHAYVTGIAIQQGKRCLLKANGKDLYFPQNSPSIGSPLKEDCAIPLGKPGNITHITIPQIAGGRIWIAEGKLTFLLNPGPALVEPSVLNPSDPNANVNFAFCEFTLNVCRPFTHHPRDNTCGRRTLTACYRWVRMTNFTRTSRTWTLCPGCRSQ